MRRAVVVALAVLAFGAAAGVANAQSPADPQASCLGLVASWEATELSPGSLGAETSGIARSEPGVVGRHVREAANVHAGSVEACLAAFGE